MSTLAFGFPVTPNTSFVYVCVRLTLEKKPFSNIKSHYLFKPPRDFYTFPAKSQAYTRDLSHIFIEQANGKLYNPHRRLRTTQSVNGKFVA